MRCGGRRTGPTLRSSYEIGRNHMQVTSRSHFDLRRCVPMSREEEHRCALAYVKTKDPVLAERLIVANMRMVVALAHHHCRADDDLRDLVQEGNRGLLRALEKYDPTRGLKFCTYAVWWIRAYMLKFTMDNWRLVKVGTTQAQRKLFFCLRKERDRLEQMGAEADTRALASRLRVKESEIVAMLERFAGSEMSLDAPAKSQDSRRANLRRPAERHIRAGARPAGRGGPVQPGSPLQAGAVRSHAAGARRPDIPAASPV